MADEVEEKRPQFGGRLLTDPSKVFEHNAWDNVEWNSEQEEEALKKIQENSLVKIESRLQDKYESEADHFWDEFYTQHQNRFFKDRHWLFTEFPELGTTAVEDAKALSTTCNKSISPGNSCIKSLDNNTSDASNSHSQSCSEHKLDIKAVNMNTDNSQQYNNEYEESFPGSQAKKRIFEVGCGVGNTVFPILEANNDLELFVYCCDFSKTAVDLVKGHSDYNNERCHAFVCDATQEGFVYPFPDESLDIILLIFVLSAIQPDKMQTMLTRLSKLLRPGGAIFFRDYGRYDLAQLRFKKGRCLSDNFYVRGDGTRVYFFEQGYVRELNQPSAYPSGQIECTQPSLASNKVEFPLKVASEPKNFHPTNIFLSPSLGITNSLAEKKNRNDEVVKQALVARNNSNEFSIASGNRIADAKIPHISSKNQCQYCNKTYTSLTNLLRHQQFHCNPHQKRPFHCKYCEKLYVSLGALKMHIRTHTLPCKCKICGKAFSRPWLLQGHVRTHTGEKPYKCINCQRAFADRSNLRAHLQTHSDVKKYCCPRCSKSFSRMSLLLKHEDSCPAHSKHHGSQ